MVAYNDPTGKKGKRTPLPQLEALDAGKWVPIRSAVWSESKAMFWVDFGNGRREWRRSHQVVFQGVLPF